MILQLLLHCREFRRKLKTRLFLQSYPDIMLELDYGYFVAIVVLEVIPTSASVKILM